MLVSAYKKDSNTTTFGFILLPTLATFTLTFVRSDVHNVL
jgi:hypothetical protein